MSESTSTESLLTTLRAEVAQRRPGDRLPSTRQLVDELHVSPVTVSRALAKLVGEGLLETRPGSGTFVLEPRQAPAPAGDLSWQALALGDRTIAAEGLSALLDPAPEDGTISLATGYPHPSLMPTRILAGAWARAARLPDAFDRPPTEGLSGLRAWFVQTATPGAGREPRDALITPGGQAAITVAIRALVPAGEPLLIESPTYPGALAVARAAGVRPVPIGIDAGGISPEHLAEAFERTRARAVYLQPTYQNPTGAVLAPERRRDVLAVAKAANAFVIEDDFARWLSHGHRIAPPLICDDTDGHVIYITSLTKATAPSLRIGAVLSRGAVTERLKVLRVVDDMFVPRPAQEAALELVTSRGWERHLRSLGLALESRAEAMMLGIHRHLPMVEVPARPLGGMHVWVRLPRQLDDVAVAAAARRAGVLVIPGRGFFPAEPPGPHLRLTFASAPDSAAIDTGLQRLGGAIRAAGG
jgi:DNA-binding transcriptional MocR family regulator